MIKRELFQSLLERLNIFPAVALLGPRQVGKTTLAMSIAKNISSVYLDLESTKDLNKLSNPHAYLKTHEDKLVILDEVQRKPELFQTLRGLIDEGRRKGIKSSRFLLLGSASIDLIKQSGESLAGRIAYMELNTLNLTEIKQMRLNDLWLRGGFPDSFLAANDKESLIWRQNFIRTYLERDIPLLGPRIPSETLRRFWTMLAHRQGGILNAEQIANNLAVSGSTVARYLDLMVDLLLVRRLMPWHQNVGKRLVKSPKIYVRDSGLTHALLGIGTYDELLGHPVVGMSWEAMVIENIASTLSEQCQLHFYRTNAGAEIDVLLKHTDGELWAIEIKRSESPKVERGFYIACEDVSPAKRYVIYPGQELYPINAEVDAISLSGFLQLLREKSPK